MKLLAALFGTFESKPKTQTTTTAAVPKQSPLKFESSSSYVNTRKLANELQRKKTSAESQNHDVYILDGKEYGLDCFDVTIYSESVYIYSRFQNLTFDISNRKKDYTYTFSDKSYDGSITASVGFEHIAKICNEMKSAKSKYKAFLDKVSVQNTKSFEHGSNYFYYKSDCGKYYIHESRYMNRDCSKDNPYYYVYRFEDWQHLSRDQVVNEFPEIMDLNYTQCEDPHQTEWEHFLRLSIATKAKFIKEIKDSINSVFDRKEKYDAIILELGETDKIITDIVDIDTLVRFCQISGFKPAIEYHHNFHNEYLNAFNIVLGERQNANSN